MREITVYEQKDITGGAWNASLSFIIGSAISFIIGIFDGIINPNKCNS